MLVSVGATALVSAGCSAVPADVTKSIADVDSNTQAIGSDFNRVLGGYVPTQDEVTHWKARIAATTDLSTSNKTWVQNHTKKE